MARAREMLVGLVLVGTQPSVLLGARRREMVLPTFLLGTVAVLAASSAARPLGPPAW